MVEIISAGGIIINHKAQVALVQNRKGYWGFPKGHIEKGETPLEAAKREIFEEAGISKLKMIKKLGILEHMKPSNLEYKKTKGIKYIVLYLFKSPQEEISPTDDEMKLSKWIHIENVLKKLRYEEDQEFFFFFIGEIKRYATQLSKL